MPVLSPFAPSGSNSVNAATNSQSIAVTAAAQDFTLPRMPSGECSVMFTVVGTDPVYFLMGAGLAVTVTNGVPLLPNSQSVLTISASTPVLSVISSGTGSSLKATVGTGV